MNNQQQYFSAKVFLKHYAQSLNTLELCARHQGLAKEYKQARQGKTDRSIKSTDFATHLFNRYIPNFKRLEDYEGLIKDIEHGISLIRRDTVEN